MVKRTIHCDICGSDHETPTCDELFVTTIKEPKKKLKSYIRAIYTGHDHFMYTASYSEKEELVIYVTGWIAKLLGFILRAKQY